MGLSDKDLLNFSQVSYLEADNTGSIELPEGVEMISVHTNLKTGYQGVALKVGQPGNENAHIIIAHAGTNDISDVSTNLQITSGIVPDQYNDARSFTENVMNSEHGLGVKLGTTQIVHTGHSLGGANAQLVGSHFGHSSVSFDPPAMNEIIEKNSFEFNNANPELNKIFIAQNSAVSSDLLQDHYGFVQTVNREHLLKYDESTPFGGISQHGIENFQGVFDDEGNFIGEDVSEANSSSNDPGKTGLASEFKKIEPSTKILLDKIIDIKIR